MYLNETQRANKDIYVFQLKNPLVPMVYTRLFQRFRVNTPLKYLKLPQEDPLDVLMQINH